MTAYLLTATVLAYATLVALVEARAIAREDTA